MKEHITIAYVPCSPGEGIASIAPRLPVGQPLTVRIGKASVGAGPDAMMRVSCVDDSADLVRVEPGIRGGPIAGWRRIAVLVSRGSVARLFVLEPCDEQNEIAFDGFFVRGRFKIVTTENNARKAREAFKAFGPQ